MRKILPLFMLLTLLIGVRTAVAQTGKCKSQLDSLRSTSVDTMALLQGHIDAYYCLTINGASDAELLKVIDAGFELATASEKYTRRNVFIGFKGNFIQERFGLLEGLEYHEGVLKNSIENETLLAQVNTWSELGKFYERNRNYSQGNECYLEALKIAEDNSLKGVLPSVYNSLAGIQFWVKEYDEAKRLMRKMVGFLGEESNPNAYRAVYSNLASLYGETDDRDSSIYYWQKVLELTQGKHVVIYGNANLGIGENYLMLDKYVEAQKYLLLSLHSEASQIDALHRAYTLSSLTTCYMKLGKLDSAAMFSEEANSLIENTEDLELKLAVFTTSSELVEHRLNSGTAGAKREELLLSLLGYRQNIESIKDSFAALDHSEEVLTQNLKLEFEKIDLQRQAEIELLAKDVEVKEKAARLNMVIFISVLIALSAIAFFLIYRSRQQRIRKQMELDRVEKELELQTASLEQYVHNLKKNSALLEELQEENESLKSAKEELSDDHLEALDSLSSSRILTEEDWTNFKRTFATVYPRFSDKLNQQFSGLSFAEKRMAMLIALELNNAEISNTLGVTVAAIKKGKQRLSKKLGLESALELPGEIQKLKF